MSPPCTKRILKDVNNVQSIVWLMRRNIGGGGLENTAYPKASFHKNNIQYVYSDPETISFP